VKMNTKEIEESEHRYKIHIEEHGTIEMLKSHYPKFEFEKSSIDDMLYFVISDGDFIGYIEVDD